MPRPIDAADIAELKDVLLPVQPFVLRYSDVHATAPHAGVVYRIEPLDTFMALRSAVTIAEFIGLEESVARRTTAAGSRT